MDTVKHNLMCISSWVINYSWSNTKSNVRSIYSSTLMRIKIWRHAQSVVKRPRKHNKCALTYLPGKKCYLARWRNFAVCGLPVCKYRKLRARGREKWTLRGPSVRCATFTQKTKSHVLWKMKQPQPRFISLCTLTHTVYQHVAWEHIALCQCLLDEFIIFQKSCPIVGSWLRPAQLWEWLLNVHSEGAGMW